ncbi:MAG: hypothetical protein F6K48_03305 [Okeania sp. SIO3H1]|nr:hypothetical protein [Okeania sp. SIO3H1]
MRGFGNDSDLTLTYKTQEVLVSLRKNREKHEAAYNKAMSEYRVAIRVELLEKLGVTEEGKDVSHKINTVRPKSFIEYYDEAIELLEHCAEETIQLSRAQANQLLRDKWEWDTDFQRSVANYG